MTEPIRRNRTSKESSASLTRVRRGKYTVDMKPTATHALRAASEIYKLWAQSYPTQISASFGKIPSNYRGP